MSNDPESKQARHALIVCCGAHVIQDGLVALQFVLLPILAQSLGLSYAQVGLLRALSNSAMSLLEIPSGILAERYGERRLLAFGLITTGIGYLGVACSTPFWMIASSFVLTGIGAGFQHSLTSSILVKTFGPADKRRALGIYNASGDAGKLTFTGIFSLCIGAGLAWSAIVTLLSFVAMLFALVVWKLLSEGSQNFAQKPAVVMQGGFVQRWGIKRPKAFSILGMLVLLDSIVQAVFLTFLAFVLLQKGASPQLASFAVVLALCGGMTGKFCCGYLTARYGDFRPYVSIQLLTIFGIVCVILLPVTAVVVTLPLVGMVVQGSSTITYGAISDHIKTSHQSRGFALIYTLANIASVVGPLTAGLIADLSGLNTVLWVLCALTALSMPLALFLNTAEPKFEEHSNS